MKGPVRELTPELVEQMSKNIDGMIPIGARIKKVRNDQGGDGSQEWNAIGATGLVCGMLRVDGVGAYLVKWDNPQVPGSFGFILAEKVQRL